MNEIKINKQAKSITFINNGIAFSQFGIAKEILDLVDNQQQEIERLNNIIKEQNLLLIEFQDMEQKVEQLENIRKEAIEYLTSYESISTIQGLDDIEKNKILDEKTMNEMVNRYLKVHDILLNILNKGE